MVISYNDEPLVASYGIYQSRCRPSQISGTDWACIGGFDHPDRALPAWPLIDKTTFRTTELLASAWGRAAPPSAPVLAEAFDGATGMSLSPWPMPTSRRHYDLVSPDEIKRSPRRLTGVALNTGTPRPFPSTAYDPRCATKGIWSLRSEWITIERSQYPSKRKGMGLRSGGFALPPAKK